VEQLGIEIKRQIDKSYAGSVAIRFVDAGSCNGCELEIHALNNPFYDVERYGIHFVAMPMSY
jgi:Ni,Fe-hydrogenase III small subunit